QRPQVQGRRGCQGPEDREARSQTPAQGHRSRRAHGRARPFKKRAWGDLTGRWVPHDTRDTLVDFVRDWSDKTDLPACRFLTWLGLSTSKFHDWIRRFGKVNEHNAL